MDLVAGAEARAWFAALAPERRGAIKALASVRRSRNLIVLALLALWVGGGVLVVREPPWPARLGAYLAMGAALHALGILMHEAIHGNLFRHRTLDRWAAFLLGAPGLVCAAAYRVTHLRHHRHNRGPGDPDEFGNYIHDRRLLSAAFYAWGALGMLVFLVHVPVTALRSGTPRERRAILSEGVLLAVLYVAVLFLAARREALDVLVQVWLLPLGVVLWIVNLRGWAEHMLTRPGSPLTQTRTVTSNVLVRLLMLNLNYHLEHHLFPGIPWYNLPRVHALLQDEYRRAGTPVYRSYLRFLWDALRTGIHGFAPAPERVAGGQGA